MTTPFPEESAYWTEDADGDPVLPAPRPRPDLIRRFLFVGGHWHANIRDVELELSQVTDVGMPSVVTSPPLTVLDMKHAETYALRGLNMKLVDTAGMGHGTWRAFMYVISTVDGATGQTLLFDAAMQYMVRGLGERLPDPQGNGNQQHPIIRESGIIIPGKGEIK